MSVVDEIKDVLREEQTGLEKHPTVQRLEAFYRGLLEKGLIERPRYSLPLPDTIGLSIEHSIRDRD